MHSPTLLPKDSVPLSSPLLSSPLLCLLGPRIPFCPSIPSAFICSIILPRSIHHTLFFPSNGPLSNLLISFHSCSHINTHIRKLGAGPTQGRERVPLDFLSQDTFSITFPNSSHIPLSSQVCTDIVMQLWRRWEKGYPRAKDTRKAWKEEWKGTKNKAGAF